MFYNIVDSGYEINEDCPYGDGNATDKIIKILEDKFNV
jgi:UDP-N-acetylglucosamine 2-epimerase